LELVGARWVPLWLLPRWGSLGPLGLVGSRWGSLGSVGARWALLGLVGAVELGLVGARWGSLGVVGGPAVGPRWATLGLVWASLGPGGKTVAGQIISKKL
jgi:hypothetical protein